MVKIKIMEPRSLHKDSDPSDKNIWRDIDVASLSLQTSAVPKAEYILPNVRFRWGVKAKLELRHM